MNGAATTMKTVIVLLCLALSGCAAGGHPLDCMTGLVAWGDCAVGTKGYLLHQQSLNAASGDDDVKCKSYGAVLGSDAYVQCRIKLDENRRHH